MYCRAFRPSVGECGDERSVDLCCAARRAKAGKEAIQTMQEAVTVWIVLRYAFERTSSLLQCCFM